jgi:hypothetical protein
MQPPSGGFFVRGEADRNMRIVGYVLILVGFICLVGAAYDQYRGTTSVRSRGSGKVSIVTSAEKPEEFHRVMAYQWTRGTLAILAGVIISAICRHEDRYDPFSTDLPHSEADDD